MKMKNTMRERINEAKDVNVYKKLLNILSKWCTKFPMTGIDTILDQVIDKGKSILPKDKRALAIIDHVLSADSFSEAVSNLLNMRFADLPTSLKPIATVGKKHELAFWNTECRISDLVKDLLNFNGGKSGFFCDTGGKKVTLLDTETEEEVVLSDNN
jgi:hypothetical protein